MTTTAHTAQSKPGSNTSLPDSKTGNYYDNPVPSVETTNHNLQIIAGLRNLKTHRQ